MFKRNTSSTTESAPQVQAVERITSVLGSGVIWHGSINGSGGIRIEGAFEGEIALRGILGNWKFAPPAASGAMWLPPRL